MEPKCRKNIKNIFPISRSDKVNHLPLESKNENDPIPAFYFKRATPKSRETCNLCSLPVSEYLFHFLVGVIVKIYMTDDVTVVSKEREPLTYKYSCNSSNLLNFIYFNSKYYLSHTKTLCI